MQLKSLVNYLYVILHVFNDIHKSIVQIIVLLLIYFFLFLISWLLKITNLTVKFACL